ncbi:MAG TPA: pyridoxal phosphate-dependent aminotransferase [Pseudonocardiaceae bacterium]|jgi:aspartate aminotransferase|nr:pyridoxal phosphate-dependent aminotransferase [Pseudonocardiaceae bacterium]
MARHSATLAINEQIQARRAAGESVLHLGFGEAGLPVLPQLAAVLADTAGANAYPPVLGEPDARAAAAGYLGRRGLPTDADQVIFAPGSKALLFALLAALPGDVVLPQPSWVSYAAQAALVGKSVIGVPVPPGSGGIPDPARLSAALATAERPGVLVLTLPDNPTGRVASLELVTEVCRIAREHDLAIISDEIYRDLTTETVLSPAEIAPERTVVTGGLSKNLALGGYRIGFARLPGNGPLTGLSDDLVGIASEVWSGLAAPMQAVAAYALAEPPEIVEHVAKSRRLHTAVARAVHQVFVAAGAQCPPPQAAFYLYPDFAVLRPKFRTGAELAENLLTRHGIGVLAGAEFGDDPAALRFRAATSLLYGSTAEQRWAALRDANPVALPWIRAALDQLRSGLAALSAD